MLANDASLFEDLQRFKRKTVNKEVDVQSSLLAYANQIDDENLLAYDQSN